MADVDGLRGAGLRETGPRAVAGYAAALAAVAAAVAIARRDPTLHDQTPFLLSAAAVMIASWVGGFGPGTLAIVLTAAFLGAQVAEPEGGFGLVAAEVEGLALYLLVALLMVALNEAGRRGAMARARLLERERAARAAAEAAEARFRELFDGAADAVLVVGPGGRIEAANPAAEALLGYRAHELTALPGGLGSLLPATEGARALLGASPAPAAGSWRGENELRRKDGSLVPVEVSAAAPMGTDRLVLLRDESGRREQWRGQGELLAGVAHDLGNPLAAVRGRLQLLKRRAERGRLSSSDLAASLDDAERAAARIEAMRQELADLARVRLGEPLELRPAPVDLAALAEGVAATHGAAAARLVNVDAEGPLVGVWDAARLERVLDNLVGNAVKYSPGGGAVAVVVRRADGEAEVAVSDDGVGIPAADLSRVFEPFRRGGNVARFGGTGVGLPTAKQIVEQHGGSISVASREGHGTTVTVRLPLPPGGASTDLLQPPSPPA